MPELGVTSLGWLSSCACALAAFSIKIRVITYWPLWTNGFYWTNEMVGIKYPSSHLLHYVHFLLWDQMQNLRVAWFVPHPHSPTEPMPGGAASFPSHLWIFHPPNKTSFSSLLLMAFDLLPSVKITSIISSSLTQWTLNPSYTQQFLLYCGSSDVKVK